MGKNKVQIYHRILCLDWTYCHMHSKDLFCVLETTNLSWNAPKYRCWRPKTRENSELHFRIVISLAKSFRDTPPAADFRRNRGVGCPLKSLLWVEPVLWPRLARRWQQDRGPASRQWGQWVLLCFKIEPKLWQMEVRCSFSQCTKLLNLLYLMLASLASSVLKRNNNLLTLQNDDIKCGWCFCSEEVTQSSVSGLKFIL